MGETNTESAPDATPARRPARDLPLRVGRLGCRIGLLGGSFNPAHEGHLHISHFARRALGLDQVWWMVSPQNPLKPSAGMAPMAQRLRHAREVAAGRPYIRVTAIEKEMMTRKTADTLKKIRQRFPGARMVWLMGADNLGQIPHWGRWTEIFGAIPIAVFDRAPYARGALMGLAARRFSFARHPQRSAKRLANRKPPAWVFFHLPRHPASATAIRSARNGEVPSGTLPQKGPIRWAGRFLRNLLPKKRQKPGGARG